jgi:hypothetical protein
VRLKIPRNSHKRRRIGMSERPPALLIRLTEDVGKLPAGFHYELPEREALALIARRKATAVGDTRQSADLVLTQDEIEAATAW